MVLHMALPTECHRNEVRNIVNIIYFLWKWHGFSNYKSTVTNIGEGDGTPLQYSCLENPMDRGAWWATSMGSQRVGHSLATAPHSSTFAWKIPWTEEPGRLQFMVLEESDTTERLHFHFSLLCIGEGNGNPLQCSCLENPRDGGAW